MSTGRITSDAAGRVLAWDAGAQELLGYSPDEAVGKLISELLVPPRFRGLHRDALDNLANGGAPRLTRPLETYALRSDGLEIPVTLEVMQAQSNPVRFQARITDRQPGQVAWHRQERHAEVTRTSPASPWEWQTAGELDRIWERFDKMERQSRQDADVVGWDLLGLPEKQAYPEMARWFLRLKERVGRSTKTGLEIINELLVRQSEHWRMSKSAVVYLGLIMPVVAVVLTVILARVIPDVPPQSPIVPTPTLAPVPTPPVVSAPPRAATP